MAIPKHDEIRLPVLQLLAGDQEIKTKDFIQPLAEHFHLSDEEVNQMYPSGNGHIFYDRISWAVSYLTMSGLISKPKRGICTITAKGKELLKTPDKINGYIDEVLKAREPVKKKKSKQLRSNLLLKIPTMT